jgi:hypothetical protein
MQTRTLETLNDALECLAAPTLDREKAWKLQGRLAAHIALATEQMADGEVPKEIVDVLRDTYIMLDRRIKVDPGGP